MPKDTIVDSIEALTRRNVETIAAMEKAAHQGRSHGELTADRFASVIGSWTFIIIQSVLFAIWIFLNIVNVVYHWDPYPFTLLNLVLAFEAALASPIIMMSQNRQGKLAERRNHLDLQINLLSEQENTEMMRLLRKLCEKQGIPLEKSLGKALEEHTKPDKIVQEIEKSNMQP